ncbi:hypothetical protein ACS15_3237 [Ralstonia insidiosa]|uniref:Uncharacterized protein n=1 Tax=Ralstonia insidiosa TaxID=190721 RepID=A0AAC9BDR2_9RALS|nr:hypothetical protein ACS15_3237 [Ralstonia insidiosa]
MSIGPDFYLPEHLSQSEALSGGKIAPAFHSKPRSPMSA